MGTVPYMSPEQVAGRAVDETTDIFSLGVVLYEMATGERPFDGPSSAELVSSILRDTPRPLAELRTDLPEPLAHVIGRCLEKGTADRIPSARALREALAAVGSAPPSVQAEVAPSTSTSTGAESPETQSIAVLPFVNMSADQENQYFSDGLSEEIINALTRIPGSAGDRAHLGVPLSRRAGPAQGGRDAGRANAARGKRAQVGQQLRITAQLIDVDDESHILERAFRPRARRCLRDPGRDLCGDRREAPPEPGCWERSSGKGTTSRPSRRYSRVVTTSPSSHRKPPSGLSLRPARSLARAGLPRRPRAAGLLSRDVGVHVRRPSRGASHGRRRFGRAGVEAGPAARGGAGGRGAGGGLDGPGLGRRRAPLPPRARAGPGLGEGPRAARPALAARNRPAGRGPCGARSCHRARSRCQRCMPATGGGSSRARGGWRKPRSRAAGASISTPGQLLVQIELIYALTFQQKFGEARSDRPEGDRDPRATARRRCTRWPCRSAVAGEREAGVAASWATPGRLAAGSTRVL